MDVLHGMRVFVRVVDTGSFTGAAQSMNSTASVVSRCISSLETHLRTRLMQRSTRKLTLTTVGEAYLARCRQILADVQLAEEEASLARQRPSGLLRMLSFTSIGERYVLPAIAGYQETYPEVTVDLTLSQQMPNLIESQADVALITAPSLPDSDLISHLLASTFSILCASPAYLDANGIPQRPEDLARHRCPMLKVPGFAASEWLLEGPAGPARVEVSGPLQVNVAESMLVAIRSGMGIGRLPLYSVADSLRDGSVVRVLPDYTSQQINIYAVYPSRHFVDAKTRTWLEYLRRYIPAVVARDEAWLNTPPDAAPGAA